MVTVRGVAHWGQSSKIATAKMSLHVFSIVVSNPFCFFETGSSYLAQPSLKLTILLYQPYKSWNYRCEPSCPAPDIASVILMILNLSVKVNFVNVLVVLLYYGFCKMLPLEETVGKEYTGSVCIIS
jgi:hypothetical protein